MSDKEYILSLERDNIKLRAKAIRSGIENQKLRAIIDDQVQAMAIADVECRRFFDIPSIYQTVLSEAIKGSNYEN